MRLPRKEWEVLLLYFYQDIWPLEIHYIHRAEKARKKRLCELEGGRCKTIMFAAG